MYTLHQKTLNTLICLQCLESKTSSLKEITKSYVHVYYFQTGYTYITSILLRCVAKYGRNKNFCPFFFITFTLYLWTLNRTSPWTPNREHYATTVFSGSKITNRWQTFCLFAAASFVLVWMRESSVRENNCVADLLLYCVYHALLTYKFFLLAQIFIFSTFEGSKSKFW